MYKRVNRTTGEEVVGSWESICDLDARIWTYAQAIIGRIKGRFVTRKEFNHPQRLCVVLVRVSTVQLWRDIYSLSDLVGWYPDLGGNLKG